MHHKRRNWEQGKWIWNSFYIEDLYYLVISLNINKGQESKNMTLGFWSMQGVISLTHDSTNKNSWYWKGNSWKMQTKGICNNWLRFELPKKCFRSQVLMAHTCSTIYLGDWDLEDSSSRPAQIKKFERSLSSQQQREA
jgi:hypothetical protein